MSLSDSEEDLDAFVMEEWNLDDHDDFDEECGGCVPAPHNNDGEDDLDLAARLDLRSERMPDTPFEPVRSGGPPSNLMQGAKNTGPKGVKEDFKESQRNLKNIRMRDALRRQRAIENAVHGNVQFHEDGSSGLENQQNKDDQKKQKASFYDKDKDEDEDSDFEDDEFLQQYRAKKQMELEQQKSTFQANLPTYGTFQRLNKAEMTKIIHSEPAEIYIIIHVYENHLESCTRLNLALENVAKQFKHVKFIRVRSSEAMANFKEIGLPAFLVYKGGEMVASALRVTDELPRAFTDSDVVQMLAKRGYLRTPTGLERNVAKLTSTRERDNEDVTKNSKSKIRFGTSNMRMQDDEDSD